MNPDEARLAATRCEIPHEFPWSHLIFCLVYNPHLRQESDQAAIKQAKYKAFGIEVQEKSQRKHDRPELASDEAASSRDRFVYSN